MKRILLAVVLCAAVLFASAAFAGEKLLTFQWDQAWSDDIAGWRLYYGTATGEYSNFVNVPLAEAIQTGTLPSGERTYQRALYFSLPDGSDVTYFFTLTAYDQENNESALSNEVSRRIDFLAPDAPINLR